MSWVYFIISTKRALYDRISNFYFLQVLWFTIYMHILQNKREQNNKVKPWDREYQMVRYNGNDIYKVWDGLKFIKIEDVVLDGTKT